MSEIKNNLRRGQSRFRKWCIPLLRQHLGGHWMCVEGTCLDRELGVDWYQTHSDSKLDWCVRIWMSRPKPHFTGRLYHYDMPGVELEAGQRFNQILLGKPTPDMSCEAFIHNNQVTCYVAPFRAVWHCALYRFPELETFNLTRNNRSTKFIRIPHSMIGEVDCYQGTI